MKQTLLVSLFLSSVLLAKEIPQHIVDTGNKLSTELLSQLSSRLTQEIKTNGILSAAKFCNSNALTLTEEVNLHQVEGISIKRISLKERNSANKPKADEAAVLESMQTMLQNNTLPAYVVEEDAKTYKFYKPLIINKGVCLKCHGDMSKDPELDEFLLEAYPQDKARGYKMGDLRGAVLVQIKE